MKKVLIFASLAVAIGIGCYYAYNQYKKLTDFCYTFGGFEVLKINRERITIKITLNLNNRSAFEIKLGGYDFSIFLNNAFVTKIASQKEQVIAPNKFTVLSLLIDVEPKNVKALANWDFISKILLDVNNVKVKIGGTVTASVAGFGVKNFPVDVESKLKDMKADKSKPSVPCV